MYLGMKITSITKKKNYLFPFLRFFGHENFAFLRSLYLWANYICSIFRLCVTFFDIHYVHLDIRWCLSALPFCIWSNMGPKELNVIRRRGGAFYLDSLIEGARVSRCPNYEVFATSMCPPVGVDWKLLLSVHHLASSGDIWCVLLETFK